MSPWRLGLGLTLLSLSPACTPRLPVERPVRVFETDAQVVVRLTSQPPGARVFQVGAEGVEEQLLGSTPLDLAHFVLRKEYWKYSPQLPPPPLEPCLACLEKRRGQASGIASRGSGFEARLRLTAPEHAPREVQVRLSPEDLPDAIRDGAWTTHVVLEPLAVEPLPGAAP